MEISTPGKTGRLDADAFCRAHVASIFPFSTQEFGTRGRWRSSLPSGPPRCRGDRAGGAGWPPARSGGASWPRSGAPVRGGRGVGVWRVVQLPRDRIRSASMSRSGVCEVFHIQTLQLSVDYQPLSKTEEAPDPHSGVLFSCRVLEDARRAGLGGSHRKSAGSASGRRALAHCVVAGHAWTKAQKRPPGPTLE